MVLTYSSVCCSIRARLSEHTSEFAVSCTTGGGRVTEMNPVSFRLLFLTLVLFSHGCAYVGPTIGTENAKVEGGKATITVSPTLTVTVPVNVAIGDKVAEAAANAAVGYLKGLSGGITLMNRIEAIQIGTGAGIAKSAEAGQQVDRKELETFLQQVVAEI